MAVFGGGASVCVGEAVREVCRRRVELRDFKRFTERLDRLPGLSDLICLEPSPKGETRGVGGLHADLPNM